MATEQEIKNAERLVRVEEGIGHLQQGMKYIHDMIRDSMEKQQITLEGVCVDVESLKGTQKTIRWVSKTAIGSTIIGLVGLMIKLFFVGGGVDF